MTGSLQNEPKVTLKLFRFNPDADSAPRYEEYCVPCGESLSMLEAIRHVYYAVDASLAFYNYSCGRGLCQGCLLEINGVTKRGCHYVLQRNATYIVAPPHGYPVIRDLLVDFGVPVRSGPGCELLWMMDGAQLQLGPAALQGEIDRDA